MQSISALSLFVFQWRYGARVLNVCSLMAVNDIMFS